MSQHPGYAEEVAGIKANPRVQVALRDVLADDICLYEQIRNRLAR